MIMLFIKTSVTIDDFSRCKSNIIRYWYYYYFSSRGQHDLSSFYLTNGKYKSIWSTRKFEIWCKTLKWYMYFCIKLQNIFPWSVYPSGTHKVASILCEVHIWSQHIIHVPYHCLITWSHSCCQWIKHMVSLIVSQIMHMVSLMFSINRESDVTQGVIKGTFGITLVSLVDQLVSYMVS